MRCFDHKQLCYTVNLLRSFGMFADTESWSVPCQPGWTKLSIKSWLWNESQVMKTVIVVKINNIIICLSTNERINYQIAVTDRDRQGCSKSWKAVSAAVMVTAIKSLAHLENACVSCLEVTAILICNLHCCLVGHRSVKELLFCRVS